MRFNHSVIAVCGSLALALCAGQVQAQTATQMVRFKVVAMNRVAIASASASLTMQRPSAANVRTTAAVAGSSYGITTNEANQKITASLNAPLPRGVSLSVALAAPDGAKSKGTKALGTASADVVTGITAVSASELPITYTLSGSAEKIGPRVVTYTITSGL